VVKTSPPNPRALTIELVPDLLDAIHTKVIAVDTADLEFQVLVALPTGRQRTTRATICALRFQAALDEG
jgi:hypothetical protein